MGLFSAALLMMVPGQSQIEPDERVEFFRTFAHQADSGNAWDVRIHGVVFEPEEDSRKRGLALSAFRRLLGIDRQQAESTLFRARAMRFLADNESGREIHVQIGEQTHRVGTSGANGHFVGTLRLQAEEVAALKKAGAVAADWLSYEVKLSDEDERRFKGHAQLVAAEGLSVISDIDDTIKHSQVGTRKALLTNTFLRPFEPVPGMSELYARWAEEGAAFHYVSGSPWQLYEPLEEFRAAEKFPPGSLHLKLFRLKDASFFDLFASQEEYKPPVIELILRAFPRRRFILVGDSGEKDPEIYGGIARKFPGQVSQILIRDITGSPPNAGRYADAFEKVPREKWQVFVEPKEIKRSQ